jgi:hypothetical protein
MLKESDNVAIGAIRLVDEVSPSPTETGDPTRGRWVDAGLRGVERSTFWIEEFKTKVR